MCILYFLFNNYQLKNNQITMVQVMKAIGSTPLILNS